VCLRRFFEIAEVDADGSSLEKAWCRIHAPGQLVQQSAGIRCPDTQLHQTNLSIPNIDSQGIRRFNWPLRAKIQLGIQNTSLTRQPRQQADTREQNRAQCTR
jgi:hypothetical protein